MDAKMDANEGVEWQKWEGKERLAICCAHLAWIGSIAGELDKPGSLQGEATVAKEPWLEFLWVVVSQARLKFTQKDNGQL